MNAERGRSDRPTRSLRAFGRGERGSDGSGEPAATPVGRGDRQPADRDTGRRPRRMGADRRRPRTVVALLVGGVLVSGCASMPDGGDVRSVGSSPRADVDSQVRVYGVRPGPGEQPLDLALGFLEATTSDEEDFDTAREYLTKEKARSWDPFESITVLAQAPKVRVEGGTDRENDGSTIVLSGTQIATVHEGRAYHAEERPYERRIHVAKVGTQWRIDRLPPGLVLGESDFQRIYRSVNTYYYAELGPDRDGSRVGPDVLVADPVYLRRRIDPVTSTVRSLLAGPTDWLAPVVRTSFPKGARLAVDELTIDDSGALTIRLNARAAGADRERCHRMAAQVLFTVQDLASTTVGSVRLEDHGGSDVCTLSREQAHQYAPDRVYGRASHQYFVDGDHRMVSLDDSAEEPGPVPGPLGAADAGLRSVAVSRDERWAAAISADGRALRVSEMRQGAEAAGTRVTARSDAEAGLTTPSWDGLGDLWVADQDVSEPRLLRLSGGTGEPEEVRLAGLGHGRIMGLRVAADGTRIAILVKQDGHTTLRLGRIERRGGKGHPKLAVRGLRGVAPHLVDVAAVSWAGGSRLVVAGREVGGVQQLRYVETDGSSVNTPALPGPSGVRRISATEDKNRPLVAESADGVVRLPPDANWKTVAKTGSAPVYPG